MRTLSFVFAAIAVPATLFGFMLMRHANGALHEIEGILTLLGAAVLWSTAAIIGAMYEVREAIRGLPVAKPAPVAVTWPCPLCSATIEVPRQTEAKAAICPACKQASAIPFFA